jgi:hypothetical protein
MEKSSETNEEIYRMLGIISNIVMRNSSSLNDYEKEEIGKFLEKNRVLIPKDKKYKPFKIIVKVEGEFRETDKNYLERKVRSLNNIKDIVIEELDITIGYGINMIEMIGYFKNEVNFSNEIKILEKIGKSLGRIGSDSLDEFTAIVKIIDLIENREIGYYPLRCY